MNFKTIQIQYGYNGDKDLYTKMRYQIGPDAHIHLV